jgi:hypothetical protein
MKLHKNYSQANCFLECSLFYAQESLVNKSKISASNETQVTACTPWYFPFLDGNYRMCKKSIHLQYNTYLEDLIRQGSELRQARQVIEFDK